MPWMGPGILLSEMTDTPLITFSPAGPLPIFMEGSGNVINLSVQPLITGKNDQLSYNSKMASKHLIRQVHRAHDSEGQTDEPRDERDDQHLHELAQRQNPCSQGQGGGSELANQ